MCDLVHRAEAKPSRERGAKQVALGVNGQAAVIRVRKAYAVKRDQRRWGCGVDAATSVDDLVYSAEARPTLIGRAVQIAGGINGQASIWL